MLNLLSECFKVEQFVIDLKVQWHNVLTYCKTLRSFVFVVANLEEFVLLGLILPLLKTFITFLGLIRRRIRRRGRGRKRRRISNF